MSEKFHIPSLPLLPLVRASVLAVVALAAVAAAGLWLSGYPAMIPTMLASVGVAMAAAGAALVPLAWTGGGAAERVIGGCMMMMLTRMVLTLLGTAALVGLAGADLKPVAGWTLAAYLLLLAVEVKAVVSRLNQAEAEMAADEPRQRASLSKESAA